MSSQFDTIEDALADIRQGRTVIVCDGEGRDSEGDLVMAAQFATPESVNFMAKEARGLICLALSDERCQELDLAPMARRNRSLNETAFTVSIEARNGVSTGISAYDRACTIQTAIDPASGAGDLVRPGHIFPLRARGGGVLERCGHTEAAVDLARLAGVEPAGVTCEILNEDGSRATVGDLFPYAARHSLRMITITDLITYRRKSQGSSSAALGVSASGHDMRTVMGHFATGVCVVSARRRDGSPVGTTVNAVTSVSLEPPLLLVCLARDSETLGAVIDSSCFAVSILSEEQREHSVRFAAKGARAHAEQIEFSEHDTGVPCLTDALATIACRVSAIHEGGDHMIVLAEALSMSSAERDVAPLLFFRGSYSRLAGHKSHKNNRRTRQGANR
jgi:3,4-dihydroxy-2-butanone 4-phosphate synthase